MNQSAVTGAARRLRSDGLDLSLLESAALAPFWTHAERLYHQTSAYRKKKIGYPDGGPEGFIESLFMILRRDDSFLPQKNLREKYRDRQQIATQFRKLKNMARSDDNLASISLLDLLLLLPKGTEAGSAARKGVKAFTRPGDSDFLFTITLNHLIDALVARLEAFEPLHDRDDTEWDQFVPQVNRTHRERIYMERCLAQMLTLYTGSAQSGLIAQAINARFNLKDDNAVTADSVNDRLRNR